ncbi:MAG: hypothetical protein BWZ06_01278 [Bacteroidetes bacterium ADurb.BinA261]|nr:MAG: hypothetical protein BWZ06_01278 [Bacteroidetes bacterium ADurb.BinA261]
MFPVCGPHPFVGSDESQMTAIVQQRYPFFVKQTIDIACTLKCFVIQLFIAIGIFSFVVKGFLKLDIRRVADNHVKTFFAVKNFRKIDFKIKLGISAGNLADEFIHLSFVVLFFCIVGFAKVYRFQFFELMK